jgi:hypothetical protein
MPQWHLCTSVAATDQQQSLPAVLVIMVTDPHLLSIMVTDPHLLSIMVTDPHLLSIMVTDPHPLQSHHLLVF